MKTKKIAILLLLPILLACFLSAGQSVAETSFDDYLVASYQMDEGSGLIVADSSGNNFDGQNINGATYVNAVYETGLLFSTNQYVRVASDPMLSYTTMSVSFWFNNSVVDASAAGIRLLNKKSAWNSNYDWNIQMNTAGRISVLGSSATTATITVFTGGSWDTNTTHHLVVTFEDTTVKAYLDSVYKGTGTITALTSSTTQLEIGGSAILNSYWNGTLDDVRIYNTTLSVSQVVELYEDNPTTTPTPAPSTTYGADVSQGDMEDSDWWISILVLLLIIINIFLMMLPFALVRFTFGILSLFLCMLALSYQIPLSPYLQTAGLLISALAMLFSVRARE